MGKKYIHPPFSVAFPGKKEFKGQKLVVTPTKGFKLTVDMLTSLREKLERSEVQLINSYRRALTASLNIADAHPNQFDKEVLLNTYTSALGVLTLFDDEPTHTEILVSPSPTININTVHEAIKTLIDSMDKEPVCTIPLRHRVQISIDARILMMVLHEYFMFHYAYEEFDNELMKSVKFTMRVFPSKKKLHEVLQEALKKGIKANSEEFIDGRYIVYQEVDGMKEIYMADSFIRLVDRLHKRKKKSYEDD